MTGDVGRLVEVVQLGAAPTLAGGWRWMRCTRCGRWKLALEEGKRCTMSTTHFVVRKREGDGAEYLHWFCPGTVELVAAPSHRRADARCESGRHGEPVKAWVRAADGRRLCRWCVALEALVSLDQP